MNLKSDRELASTRDKLRLLEAEYADTVRDLAEDPQVRELSLRSLQQLINQLKEEIARYEACLPIRK